MTEGERSGNGEADLFLATVARDVEDALRDRLPRPPACPAPLAEAIEIALLGGGKRLRPALVVAAWGACGGRDRAVALSAACAVECIHAYSLVHDDLPAMDDAELRHGLPAVHRSHGEATAILAGDALQALAFQCLAEAGWRDPALGLLAVAELARAVGALGLVAGQQDDLAAGGAGAEAVAPEAIHERKTGALFRACVRLGAMAAGVPPGDGRVAALDAFAASFGLAYQIVDDVLDATAQASVTGKASGRDRALGRRTYVSVHGVDGARRAASEAVARACSALAPLGERAELLRAIAKRMESRDR